MSDTIENLTEASFDEAIKNDLPVLVDFWAEWCGPCRAVAPILEEIANEHGDKVVIAKVNVDENPALSVRFSVRSIPTMLLFKSGEEAKRIVGAKNKAGLLKELEI